MRAIRSTAEDDLPRRRIPVPGGGSRRTLFARSPRAATRSVFPFEIESIHTVGSRKTFAFETAVSPQHAPREWLMVNLYLGEKRLTAKRSIVSTPEFCHALRATYHEMHSRIGWLQYDTELDGLNLTQAHLHLLSRSRESDNLFRYWGPLTYDCPTFPIAFRNALWLTTFLFSENPHYPESEPMVLGTQISPFELVDTLRTQIEHMVHYLG